MNKKNDGCIYTKPWVVSFMFDLCGYDDSHDLAAQRLVEPSCGNGSFVLEAVRRICQSVAIRGNSISEMKESLRAYDLNKGALDLVKDSTRAILSEYGYEKDQISDLIDSWFINDDFIGNNLTDRDLVIGNPPYIRASDISESQREQYMKELSTVSFGTDIYIAFMEKGLRLLRSTGKLCFICSDRWQKNQYGEKFRNYLKDNGYHISFNCQMHNVDAFKKNVTAYPSVTVIEKEKGYEKKIICTDKFGEDDALLLLNELSEKENIDTGAFRTMPIKDNDSFENMPLLEDAGIEVGIGIATGKDSVFVTNNPTIVEKNRLLPLAYAKDMENFCFPASPTRWLVNPWENGKLVDLKEYPRLKDYLLCHENELKERHVAKRSPSSWYRTIDKVHDGLSKKRKLLIRDISKRTEPVLDEGILYPHHNFYWMTSDVWDLEVLGGILISDIVYRMMDSISVKMRGGVLRNQAQYLRKIHIPEYSLLSEDQMELLRIAFRKRDRALADSICKELYK